MRGIARPSRCLPANVDFRAQIEALWAWTNGAGAPRSGTAISSAYLLGVHRDVDDVGLELWIVRPRGS